MRFEFKETREDGGGELTVTAESAAEIMDLFGPSHAIFNVFDHKTVEGLTAFAGALSGGAFSHVSRPAKRPWFFVEGFLGNEWLEPYRKRLERMTGFADVLPDMDLTPFLKRITHTHAIEYCRIQGGDIAYGVYVQAEEWNKRTPRENAERYADRNMRRDFGYVQVEREFIPVGNGGLYKHNPKYATGAEVILPGVCSRELWAHLFTWWRGNCASPAQRALLDKADALRAKFPNTGCDYVGHGYPEVGYNYVLDVLDPEGTCNYDGKGTMVRVMKWDEFAALAEKSA